MRPNQKNRYGGRYNNSRGNRSQTLFRNTALESSGPCGKLHGTALQLFEKYQTAAKDALLQNDLILSETCLQYADHYMRLQNIAIANEQALRSSNVSSNSTNTKQNTSETKEESPTISEVSVSESQNEETTSENASVPQEEEVKTSGKTFFKSRRRSIQKTLSINKSDTSSEKESKSIPESV